MALNIVRTPAKINLSLDILGRRPDGYHEVDMVMQSIELYDELEMRVNNTGFIKVNCKHPFVSSGPRNLVWQAARLLQKEYNVTKGVEIFLTKNIPVSSGLGGGSSNAAATLNTLSRLWGLNLSTAELSTLALRLGADVPFCLQGGTALARGIGEQLTQLPFPPRLWVTLLKPNIGVSTKAVYTKYDPDQVKHRPNNSRLVGALDNNDVDALANSMGNVLESVTFKLFPLLEKLKQRTIELGALAALMSGSGPTIFALSQDYSRAMSICNGMKHQVEFSYVTTFKEGAY